MYKDWRIQGLYGLCVTLSHVQIQNEPVQFILSPVTHVLYDHIHVSHGTLKSS